jgi:hypothetical protein
VVPSLRVFTFNQVRQAEQWRQELLADLFGSLQPLTTRPTSDVRQRVCRVSTRPAS